MALSRVGGSSAAATSIAIPTHVAGDLIVIWAYRDGSTTPPTVPAAAGTVPAFTTIDGPTGANACSAVCAWAVAAGTTDTSGTWTNATGMSVEVWRGQAAVPIGGHAQSGGNIASGANISIPAITLTAVDGTSAILGFAGWATVTGWNAAPAGYTQRSQVATECEALSKDTTTSDGAFNVTGTASGTGGTRTQQIEILVSAGNRVSQEAVEVVYSTTAGTARLSQEAIEILATFPGTQGNRVSQVAVEILKARADTRTIGFISSVSAVYTPALVGGIGVPFIASVTAVYAPSLVGAITPSFISSSTSVYTPALQGGIAPSFIASTTTVYTPALQGSVTPSFISTSTAVYTPTLTAGTTDVTPDFIASVTVVYGPGLPIEAPSGTVSYVAGTPNVYPLVATNALLDYASDDATILGALQSPSGVISYKGDAPHIAGTVAPSSGTFRYIAGVPFLGGIIRPVSSKIFYRADAPTVLPQVAQAGRYIMRGDGPVLVPIAGVAGRVRYAGDTMVIYPLQSPSGILLWRAGTPTLYAASIIVHQSGIIRWRSDVPVVTPLTEPVNPPPVTGANMKIQVTV